MFGMNFISCSLHIFYNSYGYVQYKTQY